MEGERIPPCNTTNIQQYTLELGSHFSENTAGEKLKGVDDPAEIPGGAIKLESPWKLSHYFPGTPVEGIIHLVVPAPRSGESQRIASTGWWEKSLMT